MLKDRGFICALWSLRQCIEESVGMGNEEERNARCLDYISDETVLGSKDKGPS